MEVFIPGLFLFLVAISISFLIVPRFTPLIVAILSIIVLVVAVRQHYKMFQDEYRLSTWQDSLKVYAPAIMIVSIILFIIYFILSIFTKGAVPIPSLPELANASPNSATNEIVESLNKVANSVGNVTSNIVENMNNAINQVNNTVLNNQKNNNNKNKNKNLSRSFLEVL